MARGGQRQRAVRRFLAARGKARLQAKKVKVSVRRFLPFFGAFRRGAFCNRFLIQKRKP